MRFAEAWRQLLATLHKQEFMAHTTYSARITGPVHYLGEGGRDAVIPLGPCLVEQLDGRSVDIFWGDSGDETADLSFEAIRIAEDCGNLVVLD